MSQPGTGAPELGSLVDQIANEAFAVLGTGEQIATFSSRFPGFDLPSAYEVARVVRDLRKARGENVVGRKIGFTNRAIWSGYGISGPIWNYMFDSTVHELPPADGTFALSRLPEPRIEPEIALHLASAPKAGMDERELFECVDWVAHGFEIVSSIFPRWEFTAADAVAAFGVHGALLLGKRHAIVRDRTDWAEKISTFTVDMARNDGIRRRGHAQDVLGGPLSALRFLVEELASFPTREPLKAGEIVTTGTLTEAMPVAVGQVWSTELVGVPIKGLRLQFV